MSGERGAKAIGTGEAKKEQDRSPLRPRLKERWCGGAAISSGPATARLGTGENGSGSESAANGAHVGSERGSKE
jgi:hypothetical protein